MELNTLAEWRRIHSGMAKAALLQDVLTQRPLSTDVKHSRQSNTAYSAECLNGALPIPICLIH